MSEIYSECVSKAKPAFDEKFANNPNLSDQKWKSVKRKRESEPVRRVKKKIRLERKVSETNCLRQNADENRFQSLPMEKDRGRNAMF